MVERGPYGMDSQMSRPFEPYIACTETNVYQRQTKWGVVQVMHCIPYRYMTYCIMYLY
jgi:hypothetical protein